MGGLAEGYNNEGEVDEPSAGSGAEKGEEEGALCKYSQFQHLTECAGLNLNYRKCCWVQYGTEERDSLRTWISENCEEFREMQIVRHAKNVGTMIGRRTPSSLDGTQKNQCHVC